MSLSENLSFHYKQSTDAIASFPIRDFFPIFHSIRLNSIRCTRRCHPVQHPIRDWLMSERVSCAAWCRCTDIAHTRARSRMWQLLTSSSSSSSCMTHRVLISNRANMQINYPIVVIWINTTLWRAWMCVLCLSSIDEMLRLEKMC